MAIEHNGFVKYSGSDQLMPQEETLELQRRKGNITIGVPAESSFQECRLPLVPQAVGLLIANGNKVLIENNAGKPAHFENHEFSEAGAQIVYSKEEVFKADLIIKVAPPTLEEIDFLRSRQTILSSIQITSRNRSYFEKLMAKRLTALAFEYIQDKTGSYPVIRAMSELVGTATIFIANSYLSNPKYGKGTLLGGFPGIPPAEVVILGAGTVAEYAARAAIGVGALVKVFDNSIYKLRRLQDALNTRIFTSVLQPGVLSKALATADVAIGAIHSSGGMTPCVVTEDMVKKMKFGSVIIDVSIDQGGCFETSNATDHNDPVFTKYDVTHFCVPNIASKIAHTASYAFSNFFTPILIKIGENGGIDSMIKTDYGLRRGTYLFNGTLTKPYIGEYFSLPCQDIDLLIAALS